MKMRPLMLLLLGLLTCHMALAVCGVSAEPSIERVTLFEEGRDGFTPVPDPRDRRDLAWKCAGVLRGKKVFDGGPGGD